MNNLFSVDGKLYQFLFKASQLMWINILTLFCSIPIITIGAAASAMHKLVYQIYNSQEGPLTKAYFKAFANNFRQATITWLLYLVMFVLLGVNTQLIQTMPEMIRGLITFLSIVISLFLLLSFTWIFILQSRYNNTIWATIRLSFVLWIVRPFRTIAMLLFWTVPYLLLLLYPVMVPVFLFLGVTVSAYLQAAMYDQTFQKLEQSLESAES